MLKLPIGISNFKEIRNENFYYVDKTSLIEDLLNSHCKVTLFTRPRIFGKTLTINMLENFFNITKSSKELFDGLKISKNKELCSNHMNQYPTIFITLREIEGRDFKEAFDILKEKIINLCNSFSFLEYSDKLKTSDKELFNRLHHGAAIDMEFIKS